MNTSLSPTVSIALATFNGGQYLQQQLDTLLQQTYPAFEIIISDDGSTDDTVHIVKQFQQQFSTIKFITNPRRGFIRNFENAIRNCTGDFIALCDQDDIWLPNKIQALVQGIEGYDLAYHDSLFINEKGESTGIRFSDQMNFYSGNNELIFLLNNCVSGHALMFRRTLLPTLLPLPAARFHDWWIAYVAACGAGVHYVPEVLVHYRQHEKSETDILKRKEQRTHTAETKKFHGEVNWFARASKASVRAHEKVTRFYWLYKSRETKWASAGIFYFTWQNRQQLFYIPKKSNVSIFFKILRYSWGMKLKQLF